MLCSLIELLSGWSVHRRRLILVLSAIIALGFASQLTRLQVDTSPDALVSTVEGNAELEALHGARFGELGTELMVIVQGSDVITPEALLYQRKLLLALSQDKSIANLASILKVPLATGDKEQGQRLLSEAFSEIERKRFVLALERAPGVTPILLSEDRTVSALVLTFDKEKVFDQESRMSAITRVRNVLSQFKIPSNLSVQLGGVPILREEILRKLERDRLTLNPMMMIICLLVLGATFRWWPAIVAPILAVGIAALMVVGGMALVGQPLTILTNIIPPLLIIVGLSDSVHLLGRYQEELKRNPDRQEAGRRASRAMLVACFLTSLTTAVGFASLASAKTPELQRFGIVAAIGVIFAYFSTVLFVPAFVTLMKAPPLPSGGKKVGLLERSVFLVTCWVLRHSKWVASLALLSTLALGYGAVHVQADARLLDAFEEGEEVTLVTVLLEEKLAGIRPLHVMLSVEEGSLLEPEIRRRVREVCEWALHQEGIISTYSYGELAESGASRGKLARLLTEDQKSAKVTIFFQDVGIERSLQLIEQLRTRLEAPLGANINALSVEFLGEAYTGSVGRSHVLRDLLTGLGLALVCIFLLLVFLFRSWPLGLISMPPNIIPLLATGAYMMVRGMQLNMATVITFSIGIGLAVDDSIHVVARFREESKRISSVNVALLRAARGTGSAICVTALSLSLGFSVLMLSEFVSVRQFGELIAVTVVNCLFAALLIQPALLKLVSVHQRKKAAPILEVPKNSR